MNGMPMRSARTIAALRVAAAAVLLLASAAAATPLSNVTAIAAGTAHTCAILAGGRVQCWGGNGRGSLGDGTYVSEPSPVDVDSLTSGVTAISAGELHTCAVLSGGALVCWGGNSHGQLGDNTTQDQQTIAGVVGLSSGIAAVSAGGEHTCALTSGGGAKCWGSNAHGELGDGGTTDSPVPVDVSGLSSGSIAVAAGGDFTCALGSTGGVKCWGDNSYGELGNGSASTGANSLPADVPGLDSGVAAIAAGQDDACAITTSGALLCWGRNDFGQVGDGTFTERHVPTPVSGLSSGVLAVSIGAFHACALVSGGGVKCWGLAGDGELGNDATGTQPVPVDVEGIASGATAIATGLEHGCALMSDATVRCWGGNYIGQLGNGTTNSSLVPVAVGFPGSQDLTFGALSNRDVNDAPFAVAATASSGLPVVFTSTTPDVCSLSASTVTVLDVGVCRIQASQPGDGDYFAAPSVERPFLVTGSKASWPSRLANISTRVNVASGSGAAIAGFVVPGPTAKSVVIRGIGPSLFGFVANRLGDPAIRLVRQSDGATIASNDDWGYDASAFTVLSIGLEPADPHEAAMLVTLDPGAYTVVMSGPAAASGVGLVEVYEIDHADVPLINISTRGSVGTGSDVMIGGFVVQGTTPQTVVVRGIGPSLSAYGIGGALSNPTLQLVRMSDGAMIAANDDWSTDPNAAEVIANGLAPSDPHESAIFLTLDPGAYTAIVSGANGATGVGMVEVYAARVNAQP